jgi:TrpR-related protein YerC/YecD
VEKSKEHHKNTLFRGILKLETEIECEKFFRDLLTERELKEMTLRFRIARLLSAKKPKSYLEIAKQAGTSTTTVTRVAHSLRSGTGGYKLVLKKIL